MDTMLLYKIQQEICQEACKQVFLFVLFFAVRGPLTVVASPVAEHRLRTRRLSAMAHGPSRSAACGIFPDRGTNPCPLHRQGDSQPLHHQGSPNYFFLRLGIFAKETD